MKRRVLTTLVSIALLAANSRAQQPAPTPPPVPVLRSPQKSDADDVVKITTNLVQVDAVVTDKNGKPVTDLRPDEVQIFEDEKPQKITHFAYNVTGTESANRTVKPLATEKSNQVVAPPVVPVPLKRESVRRTIAIVVDDLGLSFVSAGYMRRALKKIVDEQIQPGDLVAIIRTGGGVGSLQQFTSDKRQLYAAIERVRWNPMGVGDTGAFSAIRPRDLKIPGEQGNSGVGAAEHRTQVAGGSMVGTLSYVVHGLRDMPGRKSVLLLSDGLGLTSYMKMLLDPLIDLAHRASVVIHTMDARGLATLGLQPQDNVQMLSDAASRVDVRGLGRGVGQVDGMMTGRREGLQASQDGLNYLAKETGGIPIRDTNDFSGGIQRVLDDQRGYYLIGYRPDEATFDAKNQSRRHNLSLKVTRPGKFNVRMRNGFFGTSEEEHEPPQKTTAQQMLNAVTSPFGSSEVHLQLTSLFGNDATNGSFMRSFLHIDARDLTFKDGPNGTHECVFDVLAMTFGDNGVPVDNTGQTYTVQLPDAVYQRAMRQGFVFNVTVPIKKPGAYQFRISLRDTATDRIGSAGQFIEVPDLGRKRLALSGVLLSGKTIAASGANSNPTAQDGKVTSETDPEAGPAVRRFRQMMRLEYGLLVYNAALDKASGKPQLTTQIRMFRDGKQVFSGDELPFNLAGQTDMGRLVVASALELGTDLPPGEYIFQIIVSDALADKKYRVATQWMDFEIIK
jgi:VWFA-related protein